MGPLLALQAIWAHTGLKGPLGPDMADTGDMDITIEILTYRPDRAVSA